jgi:hypothetical protein
MYLLFVNEKTASGLCLVRVDLYNRHCWPLTGGFACPSFQMYYGTIVSMYFFDNTRHHRPHIHVRYQGKKPSLAFLPASC